MRPSLPRLGLLRQAPEWVHQLVVAYLILLGILLNTASVVYGARVEFEGGGGGGGNSFETIDVPAGTDPVADSATDTLTFTETSFLTLTGTAGTDTIDITQVTTDLGTDGLIAANAVALTTDTTGNYVAEVADGTGIDGTAAAEGATYTPTLDLTEINSTTWGSGTFTTMTFDAGATDPVWTYGSNSADLTTGVLKYAGNTVATSANDLSFFAATTSAQLAGVISNETGSGLLTYATSPTLTTPRIADLGFIADANGNELVIYDTVASAVNEITWANAATTNAVTLTASGGDTNVSVRMIPKGTGSFFGNQETYVVAFSDETTALTTGTAKVTFHMPYAFSLMKVKAGVTTASSSGNPAFDLNDDGVSVFSTTVTIDANETFSDTAATASVLTATPLAIASGSVMTVDIDTAGTGTKGGKLYLIGYATASP